MGRGCSRSEVPRARRSRPTRSRPPPPRARSGAGPPDRHRLRSCPRRARNAWRGTLAARAGPVKPRGDAGSVFLGIRSSPARRGHVRVAPVHRPLAALALVLLVAPGVLAHHRQTPPIVTITTGTDAGLPRLPPPSKKAAAVVVGSSVAVVSLFKDPTIPFF